MQIRSPVARFLLFFLIGACFGALVWFAEMVMEPPDPCERGPFDGACHYP